MKWPLLGVAVGFATGLLLTAAGMSLCDVGHRLIGRGVLFAASSALAGTGVLGVLQKDKLGDWDRESKAKFGMDWSPEWHRGFAAVWSCGIAFFGVMIFMVACNGGPVPRGK